MLVQLTPDGSTETGHNLLGPARPLRADGLGGQVLRDHALGELGHDQGVKGLLGAGASAVDDAGDDGGEAGADLADGVVDDGGLGGADLADEIDDGDAHLAEDAVEELVVSGGLVELRKSKKNDR